MTVYKISTRTHQQHIFKAFCMWPVFPDFTLHPTKKEMKLLNVLKDILCQLEIRRVSFIVKKYENHFCQHQPR